MFKKFLFLSLFLFVPFLSYSKVVLISFDGSGSREMWRETLEFALENNLKFTYFISAPYFVTESQLQYRPYWAISEIGKPFVKFRKDSEYEKKAITERLAYLVVAKNQGHEIASHLCGHYDGSKWTYEEWVKELTFFNDTFKDVGVIDGIRAPNLGVNEEYFKAIKKFGYKYDSSLVFSKNKIYSDSEIPIRNIKIYNRNDYTLPFDYNFNLFSKHYSEQKEEDIFFNSLCYDYLNNPNPTQICLHFQTFPGQPYMKAMEHFVLWLKDKKPTYLTYKQFFLLDKKTI